MKLAVIGPTKLLDKYGDLGDNYHLLLSTYCVPGSEYEKYYLSARERGHYLILDNAAHEQRTSDPVEKLIRIGQRLGASEVVLPDFPCYGEKTLQAATDAYPMIRDSLPGARVMGVVHGYSFAEFMFCATGLIDLGVDTLGISRDGVLWGMSRADVLSHILTILKPWQEIHLLGADRDPQDAYQLGLFCSAWGAIRGIDTAKPLVFASHGQRLDPNPISPTQPFWLGRLPDFFELEELDDELARHNISVYKSWVSGLIPSA